MRKNRQAVTLIETLISLTIVGVALVALLPVVTVKKASTVADYGNIYWDNSQSFDNNAGVQPYLCPNNANVNRSVSVGAGDTQPSVGRFSVFNQGFGNSDNFPLAVTERLVWNGTTIKQISAANYDSLHIGSNPHPAQTNNISYRNNLYFAPVVHSYMTPLIIERNTTQPSLYQAHSNTADPYNVFHVDKLYDGARTINLARALYTIRLEGNEYMHMFIAENRPANNENSTFTHIGIGRNAVKSYSHNTDNSSVIAIANTYDYGGNTTNFSSSCNSKDIPDIELPNCVLPDLVIGAKKVTPIETKEIDPDTGEYKKDPKTGEDIIASTISNYYNNPTHWVIHHSASTHFTINADIVNFPTIYVTKVILPSDKRLKNIADEYKKGINELLHVKPVEFVYKSDKQKEHHIGVIAQDLRKVFPEAVETNSSTGYLMVGTDPVFYALINAVKELNLKNKELKFKNDELENKIAKLRKIRDDLKASQGGAK